MNRKFSMGFLVVLGLSVLIMQGCSRGAKENAVPPTTEYEQKNDAAQQKNPRALAPEKAVPTKRIDVTNDMLREMLAANKDLFILDVRGPEELISGPAPLENTVNIPLPEIGQRYNELPRDKEIMVVCRTGRRSAIAADFLIDAGFPRVYNLLGGMTEYWRTAR